MEENNIQNYVPEEEGIDILDIVRKMWNGRKTIIICTCIFIVLGLVAALTMKRTYSVSTLMVPQMNAKGSSSLSSLASLAGFDIGTGESSGDLSPLTYPQIVNSVPFRLKLLYTPLHYEKVDTAVSMFTYAKEYSKPSVMSKVKKYTIGLPFTILGALRGEKEDVVLPAGGDDASPKPLVLTEDEVKYLELIARSVSLSVDKKEGLVTLSVTGSEPLQTAELAIRAQNLLQEEVTRFRTERQFRNWNTSRPVTTRPSAKPKCTRPSWPPYATVHRTWSVRAEAYSARGCSRNIPLPTAFIPKWQSSSSRQRCRSRRILRYLL